MKCILCESEKTQFKKKVHVCEDCGLLFKDQSLLPDEKTEIERYNHHQNRPDFNNGHREFLQTILEAIKPLIRSNDKILDFGCGPYPLLVDLFKEMNLSTKGFDPFYANDVALLNEQYDFISTVEVVEHFHHPLKSFELLNALLRPEGRLAIRTLFYDDKIDFERWWYKNDVTHVVFYSHKTWDYLSCKFNFNILYNDHKSMIVFEKKK